MVTVDEGDHSPAVSGLRRRRVPLVHACELLVDDHAECPSNQIGEVNSNIEAKLPATTPSFASTGLGADLLRQRAACRDRPRAPHSWSGRRPG